MENQIDNILPTPKEVNELLGCPCDDQCREECELCRDRDTIQIMDDRENKG